MRCAPCSLGIRVSDEDTNEVFNVQPEESIPGGWTVRS